MTDFIAQTDFCFTNSNAPSPQCTFCCFVRACLVHILSWSHSRQTPAAPINAGRSLLPLAALVLLRLLKVVLPSSVLRDKATPATAAGARGAQEGQSSRDRATSALSIQPPQFSCLAAERTTKFSSFIYCLPKWEVFSPGPSLLIPDKETQLREAF